VVRDSSRWRAIRDSIYVYRAPGMAEPQVDFRREMLIVAVGPRAAPEDSLSIGDVSLSHGHFRVSVVSYREWYPMQQVTMPFHVVLDPRSKTQPTSKEKLGTQQGQMRRIIGQQS
jgi:hypothetical protein